MYFSHIVLNLDGSHLLREYRIWVKYAGMPLTKPTKHLQEKYRGNPLLLRGVDFCLLEQSTGKLRETCLNIYRIWV